MAATTMTRLGLLACLALGGCSGLFTYTDDDTILFDGINFRHKAKAVDSKDRKNFVVTVRPVSASMTAAREAGKYEATVYCINYFGKSDVKWSIGPDSEVVPVENDTLTLTGRCNP